MKKLLATTLAAILASGAAFAAEPKKEGPKVEKQVDKSSPQIQKASPKLSGGRDEPGKEAPKK